MVTVYLYLTRYTREYLTANGTFTVSFFPEECRKVYQHQMSKEGMAWGAGGQAGRLRHCYFLVHYLDRARICRLGLSTRWLGHSIHSGTSASVGELLPQKDSDMRHHIVSPAYECIDRGMDFVSSNIDWHVHFTGGTRREEVAEVPMVALREIIVNAFAHGDYDASTDFEIDVYSDRVCVYSPGMFPKPYTPEDFARQGIEPIPLNKAISETLFRDGTIEQVSTGFERVFEACAEQGVRYTYEETATGFRFTFYRHGSTGRALTTTEEKLLAAMRDNPLAGTKELAEACGVTVRTVQRLVKSLTGEGLVMRTPAGDGYAWEVFG